MSFDLQLGPHQRARLWEGEAPNAWYAPAGSLERIIPAADGSVRLRRFVVELARHVGPRVHYGLLGAVFTPVRGSGTLHVVALHGPGVGAPPEPFPSAVAWRPEEPVVGLPRQLAEAVLIGVERAVLEGAGLGSGLLAFDCSANGPIGSSHAMFGHLARIVTTGLSVEAISKGDFEPLIPYITRPVG